MAKTTATKTTRRTRKTTRRTSKNKQDDVIVQNMTDEVNVAGATEEIEDIDALLAAEFAELSEDEVADEQEASADDVSEDEVAAAVAEVEMEEAKAEAYAEQDAGEDMSTEPVEKKPTKPKAPRKTMAGYKKSEVVRDKLGENLKDVLVLEVSDAELDAKALSKKQDAILKEIDGMAKKVGEKAVNLLGYLHAGTKLSNYTQIALKLLIEKGDDGLSTKELIETLNKTYSIGTSRSQAHQMFQLFPKMAIATLEGKTMKVNPNSTVVAKFSS